MPEHEFSLSRVDNCKVFHVHNSGKFNDEWFKVAGWMSCYLTKNWQLIGTNDGTSFSLKVLDQSQSLFSHITAHAFKSVDGVWVECSDELSYVLSSPSESPDYHHIRRDCSDATHDVVYDDEHHVRVVSKNGMSSDTSTSAFYRKSIWIDDEEGDDAYILIRTDRVTNSLSYCVTLYQEEVNNEWLRICGYECCKVLPNWKLEVANRGKSSELKLYDPQGQLCTYISFHWFRKDEDAEEETEWCAKYLEDIFCSPCDDLMPFEPMLSEGINDIYFWHDDFSVVCSS